MTDNNRRPDDYPVWYYGEDGPIAWCDAITWTACVERTPRWRQWMRRHLWILTYDGRQDRKLARLLDAIDRKAKERER
jgi:hypothetical protein